MLLLGVRMVQHGLLVCAGRGRCRRKQRLLLLLRVVQGELVVCSGCRRKQRLLLVV